MNYPRIFLKNLFFSVLISLLVACAAYQTQPPDIDLERVHPAGAHRLAFAPGGKKLASGGFHGKIHVWSVEDGAAIKTLAGHTAPVRGLAWLDEQRLISADRSGRILLWELPSSRIVHSRQLNAVHNMAPSPDRAWLLVIEDTRLHKLALPSLQTLAQHDAGSRLLVWDLPQRRLEERPTEHLGKVVSVDISPDSERWLSLGRSTDSNFRLIDADSNQVLRRFQPHHLCGWQVRFSPDGRYAASAAEDGSIHIYDLNQPYRPVVPYAGFDE